MKNIAYILITASALTTATARDIAAQDFDAGGAAPISQTVVKLKAQAAAAAAPGVSTASAPSGLARFWEDLKKDTLDDACENVEIELNENVKFSDMTGLKGGFKRYLRKFPNGKIALIDEANLNLSLGIGREVINIPDTGGMNVSLTGMLEGKSQVIRPLVSARYCKELKALAKLSQVKTVLHADAGRIAAMQNGEIWKLPLTLRMGFSAGIGVSMQEVLAVYVSAGRSRESRPSVTLYRMDENNLRLRLRLDRVDVRSSGASVSSMEIPVADIGLVDAENVLAREINKAWAKELNRYIALKLSYGRSSFSGKKLLMEFVLNPNSPEQMAALEKFLRGDFGVIGAFLQMGLDFNQFSGNDDAADGYADIVKMRVSGERLDSEPGFVGSNIYSGRSDSIHIQVPVMHTHDTTLSSSYNRYQALGGGGATLHVQQQGMTSAGNTLNIPFAGTMVKYSSQKNAYVVNREEVDGRATQPVMMYQQNEGFVRQGDGTARYMIGKANGLLRYVGANGAGTDGSNLLPAADIFPPAPEDADPGRLTQAKIYNSAVMSFKLLINERGVQGIVLAPVQAILKAYMNMMRETEAVIIDKVMDLFTVNKEGEVGYDHRAMQKRLATTPFDATDNGANALDIVRTLARAATQVIRDINSVKETSDWKERSARLSRIAAGDSRSGLKYDAFLKVALQLVAREDVSAEVYLHTDKRVKGEADVTQTYQFFNTRENKFDKNLSEVTQAQERFAEPALLSD